MGIWELVTQRVGTARGICWQILRQCRGPAIMTSMTWSLSEANAAGCWRTGTGRDRPMFLDDTLSFSALLTENNIPYAMLNTSADGWPLSSLRPAMYESGRCCADILMSMSDEEQRDKVYMVQIERDSKAFDPLPRQKRFCDYRRPTTIRTRGGNGSGQSETVRGRLSMCSPVLSTGFPGGFNIVTMNPDIPCGGLSAVQEHVRDERGRLRCAEAGTSTPCAKAMSVCSSDSIQTQPPGL